MRKQQICFIFLFFICLLMPSMAKADLSIVVINSPGPGYEEGSNPYFLVEVQVDEIPTPGRTVTFSIEPDDGNVSFAYGGSTRVTGSNGRAGATLNVGDGASGTYTVTASSGTVSVSRTVTVGTVPSLSVSVSSSASNASPGDTVTFTATVTENNNPASDQALTFGIIRYTGTSTDIDFIPTAGTASLSSTSATTDSNGQASTSLSIGSDASGSYGVSATLSGGQLGVATVTVEASASPPPSPEGILLSISTNNSNFEPGDTVTFTVEAKKDTDPAPDQSVIFSVSPDDGAASLSTTSATTDSNGEAQTTLNLGTDASGSYTVTASVGTTSTSTTVKVEIPTVSQRQQRNTNPNPGAQQATGTQQNTAQPPVNPPTQQPDAPSNGDTEPSEEDTQDEKDTQQDIQPPVQPPANNQGSGGGGGTLPKPVTSVNPTAEPFDYERTGVGRIVFSEWMLSKLNDMPQWIELYNTTNEDIDLRGWQIVGRFIDGNNNVQILQTHRLGSITIKSKETHLITAYPATVYRGSFSENMDGKTYSLQYNRQLWTGKAIVLELQDNTGNPIDRIGNLNENDEIVWKIPARTRNSVNKNRRISLIRRLRSVQSRKYNLRFGMKAFGWFPADEVEKLTESNRSKYFYGSSTDIGTPGYRTEGADPLPVRLSSFVPHVSESGVVLQWTTESELENAGFNILRSINEKGPFTKINPKLIQGAGTTSERNAYQWIDTTAKTGIEYYYRIEDMSFDGVSEVLATQRLKGVFTPKNRSLTRWAILKKATE